MFANCYKLPVDEVLRAPTLLGSSVPQTPWDIPHFFDFFPFPHFSLRYAFLLNPASGSDGVLSAPQRVPAAAAKRFRCIFSKKLAHYVEYMYILSITFKHDTLKMYFTSISPKTG